MEHEYPSPAELETLAKWEFGNAETYAAFAEYVAAVWNTNYGRVRRRGRYIIFVTGGWSGNEQVIEAIHQRYEFDSLCWVMSKRGGWHCYELPDPAVFDTQK